MLRCTAENQVELDHLQRDRDGPIDVAVQNWGAVDHQGTDVHGGLPMVGNVHGLHQEEHGRGNHGDGDDPESDGDGIRGAKEAMVLAHGVKTKASASPE